LRKRVENRWNGRAPQIGDKVMLWVPKDLRGVRGTVVATENGVAKSAKDVKPAPEGKYRVRYRDPGSKETGITLCPMDAIAPAGTKVKDILANA
jgi:hypothetical protein